jgi:hypothetical protein
MEEHRNGGIVTRRPVVQPDPEISEKRMAYLRSAVLESSQEKMELIATTARDVIQTTLAREGVVRKFMLFREVKQGDPITIRMKKHEAVAVVGTTEAEVKPLVVRSDMLMPAEFQIKGGLIMDIQEILQTSDDILEEKYDECLEAILVAEDRQWKWRADIAAIQLRNNLQYFSTLTPKVLHRIRDQVSQHGGVPLSHYIFESSVWEDLKEGSGDWVGYLDPVHRYSLVEDGVLGSCEGVPIITDWFRQANLRFLQPGEIYAVAPPDFHGLMTTRGPLLIEKINMFPEYKAQTGWFFWELISMTVKNANSVSKGQKSY